MININNLYLITTWTYIIDINKNISSYYHRKLHKFTNNLSVLGVRLISQIKGQVAKIE